MDLHDLHPCADRLLCVMRRDLGLAVRVRDREDVRSRLHADRRLARHQYGGVQQDEIKIYCQQIVNI